MRRCLDSDRLSVNHHDRAESQAEALAAEVELYEQECGRSVDEDAKEILREVFQ
jgi:hypothetical protein